MRIIVCLVCFLCCPVLATDEVDHLSEDPGQPPAGLLEFLGDMDPVEEEIWQMLEQNALQDVAEKKEASGE